MIPENCKPLMTKSSKRVFRWSPKPASEYGAPGPMCWQGALNVPAWNLMYLFGADPNRRDMPMAEMIDLIGSMGQQGRSPQGVSICLASLAVMPISWANSLVDLLDWERSSPLPLWNKPRLRLARVEEARNDHPDLYAAEAGWTIKDVTAARTVLRSLGFKNFADV